jgi:hypothetical protein
MAKATLKMETSAGETSLLVRGELKVQQAAELKDFFLQSVRRSGKETLVLHDVTAFDIASAQLTHLWKKSLEQQGRQPSISLPKDQGVKELLEKTGITNLL